MQGQPCKQTVAQVHYIVWQGVTEIDVCPRHALVP